MGLKYILPNILQKRQLFYINYIIFMNWKLERGYFDYLQLQNLSFQRKSINMFRTFFIKLSFYS